MHKDKAMADDPMRKAATLLVYARMGGWFFMSLWFGTLAFSASSINDISTSIFLVSALLLIANEMTVISDDITEIRKAIGVKKLVSMHTFKSNNRKD